MKVLDLFSGIGGFSLGLERAGMETVAFCEIEPYCQKVLKKHWPDVPIYEDVRNVSRERLDADGIGRIDVITGGFPCQDISLAGKQAGIEGERSGLWGELARIIGDIRPKYAIVENVTALISGDRGRWFGRVLGDLAEIGYDAEWHCIPASAIGAPHHRDRVWIIAYPNSNRSQIRLHVGQTRNSASKTVVAGDQANGSTAPGKVGCSILADAISIRQPRPRLLIDTSHCAAGCQGKAGDVEHVCVGAEWTTEPGMGRVANGIPRRVDRLKGLGNAVVPQIPEIIGRAILEAEKRI